MTAEARPLDAGEVVAAARSFDEPDAVAGGQLASLGFTRASVAMLSPREWEVLAAWLFAQLERAPMKSSPAYTGHRIVLGGLANELRGYAHSAGEPVGIQADLRDTKSQAEEQRLRARLADQEAAYDRHVDDVLLAEAAQREHGKHEDLDPLMDAATGRALALEDERMDTGDAESPADAPAPAAPQEKTDANAWLL